MASSRAIRPSDDPELLTVAGDISKPGTAERIVDSALARFGRIDTLVNNAGVFISKPFTEYTTADFARVVGVNLTGFFWVTQRVIAEMARRYGGRSGEPARSATSWTASCSWSPRRTSPARSCTSTAARSPVTEA